MRNRKIGRIIKIITLIGVLLYDYDTLAQPTSLPTDTLLHSSMMVNAAHVGRDVCVLKHTAYRSFYLKREMTFKNRFAAVNFGKRFLVVVSKAKLLEEVVYNTRFNGVLLEPDFRYKYIFNKRWSAKAEGGSIGSPKRPKAERCTENIPIRHGSKLSLFMVYVEVGISIHL